ALTALSVEEKKRGVVGATRGNHGAGLAWAGQALHIPVCICVPRGNNPEKNEAMRGFGAELIEEGDDYDAAAAVADRLVKERGMTLVHSASARTFADGLATRNTYEMTFAPLLEGLTGFVKVAESAIADAIRLLLRTTHNLAEGAGAAGLAGLFALRETLAGKSVAICISGANIDQDTLRKVLAREL